MKHTNNTKATHPHLPTKKSVAQNLIDGYFMPKKILYFTKQCEICLPQNIYFTAAIQQDVLEPSNYL